MHSIGFKYNNKDYTCQPIGTGLWQCPPSSTPADIQLNCQTDGVNKINCTLPESTTNLICDISISPFNCNIQNTNVQNYLQNRSISNDNTNIVLVGILILFLLLILINVYKK